ncbi:hypothetical protein BDQ17DRAFT_1341809 [Cyathus striatus]|nr:hypothetical protein BDQ17DRAFT_1341809 [Cyathus striatus]
MSRHNRSYSSSSHSPMPVRQSELRATAESSTSYSPTVTSGGQQTKINIVTRMYLKMSVPLDSVVLGSTIPLFQENVKILTSQVHPIDNNSIFGNLLFGIQSLSPQTSTSVLSTPSKIATNSESMPPVDPHFTGHILVSGYHISYVLPKLFPRNRGNENRTETELEALSQKITSQFIAAIDMWVPFVSRPPRAPYLLSIPTPRCLHNQIKLRIFPPSNSSSSYASLSSIEDDSNSWDLTSDPHVTRSATSRLTRSNSYTQFADDESSDSSTAGFSDGCGIQGTFPSAERVRVRWAKPIKTIVVPGHESDGRRRVGVKEVKGEMTCVCHADGIQMRVEYRGTCKGVWFPGVATLLGMDISLEAKGSEVYDKRWSWLYRLNDNAGLPSNHASRTSSFNSDSSRVKYHPEKSESLLLRSSNGLGPSPPSTTSTHSLLRAPLPAQNVADYSFEDSHASFLGSSTSPHGTLSSMSSVPAFASMDTSPTPSPAAPADSFLVVLPRFTVLAADTEMTTTVVRNELDGDTTAIEVYNPTGNIHKDPQSRKTVLRKGGFTRCGDEGGRICLKDIGLTPTERNASPLSTPRTSTGKPAVMLTTIPNVKITVTPLLSHDHDIPHKYTVRIKLDSPPHADSEWVEFGLSRAPSEPEPHVQIVSARVDGCAVKYETRVGTTDVLDGKMGLHVPFENMGERVWSRWIKINAGNESGKCVIVDYVVEGNRHAVSRGLFYWSLARQVPPLPILLPTFILPVGTLETKLDLSTSLDISAIECNLPHYKTISNGRIFSIIAVWLHRKRDASGPSRLSVRTYFLLTWALILLGFTLLYQHVLSGKAMEKITDNLPATSAAIPPEESAVSSTTVTTTTTIYTTIFIPTSTSTVSSHATFPIELKQTLPARDNSPPIRETEISSDKSRPEEYGLIPLAQMFDFSWIHWEMAQENMQNGLEKVAQAMEVVWQFCRKAYHYPLDPP